MWELRGVTNEEHGSVVEDPIPVTLLCVELDGESCQIKLIFIYR